MTRSTNLINLSVIIIATLFMIISNELYSPIDSICSAIHHCAITPWYSHQFTFTTPLPSTHTSPYTRHTIAISSTFNSTTPLFFYTSPPIIYSLN